MKLATDNRRHYIALYERPPELTTLSVARVWVKVQEEREAPFYFCPYPNYLPTQTSVACMPKIA